MKISLITNGLALKQIPKATLAKLTWIRVSIQSVKHLQNVAFDYIPHSVKVSASYILNPHDREKDFRAIHDFVKARHLVTRIAVAQPCDERADVAAEMIVRAYGAPFFFARKERGVSDGCYMAWIRATIDWRGFFLPCPSVMLADDEGKISNEFRLCHVSALETWLLTNTVHDLGYRCTFCNCGKSENDFMHAYLNGVEDDEFV